MSSIGVFCGCIIVCGALNVYLKTKKYESQLPGSTNLANKNSSIQIREDSLEIDLNPNINSIHTNDKITTITGGATKIMDTIITNDHTANQCSDNDHNTNTNNHNNTEDEEMGKKH